MQVRVLQECDADLGRGEVRALFEGQSYDIPEDSARALIAAGKVEEIVTESKAVEGPPQNKALDAPRRTRRRRAQ